MPKASARTTCPKQPSPRGFPSTSLDVRKPRPQLSGHDCCPEPAFPPSLQAVYLSRGNSHSGSRGRSRLTRPASKGGPLEERRTPRTRDELDLAEEPDSRENCKVGGLVGLQSWEAGGEAHYGDTGVGHGMVPVGPEGSGITSAQLLAAGGAGHGAPARDTAQPAARAQSKPESLTRTR